MLDKVMIIQKWYRGLVEKWDNRSEFKKVTKAAMIVQRYFREQ